MKWIIKPKNNSDDTNILQEYIICMGVWNLKIKYKFKISFNFWYLVKLASVKFERKKQQMII